MISITNKNNAKKLFSKIYETVVYLLSTSSRFGIGASDQENHL